MFGGAPSPGSLTVACCEHARLRRVSSPPHLSFYFKYVLIEVLKRSTSNRLLC